MKISCIVAFKLTRICLTKKRAKWSLEPKCTFFASEVWTLEDQAEKLQLQVLVLPEKDNSFWNYKSNDNDSEHNALTFSKEYFPNEMN